MNAIVSARSQARQGAIPGPPKCRTLRDPRRRSNLRLSISHVLQAVAVGSKTATYVLPGTKAVTRAELPPPPIQCFFRAAKKYACATEMECVSASAIDR